MKTKYSFNANKSKVVFGRISDVNASFKDLAIVCTEIRYKSYSQAQTALDNIISGKPIIYRKYNKGMGSRHELSGRKGRTPIKCAKIVNKVLLNTANNAQNKGLAEEDLIIVHACANKTIRAVRSPSQGRQVGVPPGRYGFSSRAHSDLEFAKVEIGVSINPEEVGLSKASLKKIQINKKRIISVKNLTKKEKKSPKAKKHPMAKGQVKPKVIIDDEQTVKEVES